MSDFLQLASEAEEEPSPPIVLALVEILRSSLRGWGPLQDRLVAATEGSSECNVGASGFFLPELSFQAVMGVPGEDQGPYKAELCALRVPFATTLACDVSQLWELHVLVDRESPISAVLYGDAQYPLLVGEIQAWRQRLMRAGVSLCLGWVPSHKKASVWQGAHAELQRQ